MASVGNRTKLLAVGWGTLLAACGDGPPDDASPSAQVTLNAEETPEGGDAGGSQSEAAKAQTAAETSVAEADRGAAPASGQTPSAAGQSAGDPALDAGTAGEATAEGPCGSVFRFELVVDTPFAVCAASPPLHGRFANGLALSCDGEPCTASTFATGYTVVPAEGVVWEWDGQVVDPGNPVCTDSIPGSCWYEGGSTQCAEDMPAARSGFGSDADGRKTLDLIVRLVSPEGTCTNDAMAVPVPVGGQAGDMVQVHTSELTWPETPATVACGDLTCDGPTQFCELDRAANDAARCVAYPATCLDDHRCDCIARTVDITAADVCSDSGMLGVAGVTRNAIAPN